MDTTSDPVHAANPEQLSTYISPREIAPDAPWRWLAAGWTDLKANLGKSLTYGLVFVGLGYFFSIGLWYLKMGSMIPVAAGGFALIGPLIAVGLYEIARRTEAHRPVFWSDLLPVKTQSTLQLAYVGFLLMFAFIVWMRIAIMIYALFYSSTFLPMNDFAGFVLGTPQGLAMLVVGSIVGGIIAFAIYAACVTSVPMLMDRKTDFLTAVASSIHTVVKNPKPMILWAWIVGGLIALCLATGFTGLALVFPLLGYSTWHAYRDLFPDESAGA